MMTAVGLSAPETAAAVRAGLMRFTESSIIDVAFRPIKMGEVPAEGLPPLAAELQGPGPTAREARLLRLATQPLRECAVTVPIKARPVPLVMALPETATTRPLDVRRVVSAVSMQIPDTIDAARAGAPFTGRAGGLIAIGRAADLVRSRQADFIIAGGVDTYRDLYVLATLERERRVKTSQTMDGLIPGEGAGFVLVARREAADRAGLSVLAEIRSWSQAVEPGHLYSEQPYRGEGLAMAIQQTVATANTSKPIQDVYSSMNGENHWAKEWGVSLIRNRKAFAEDHVMWHPADCYGDTGAAAAPIMVGLAALDIMRGMPGRYTLIYGSSDRGERAALILAA
jgi:3-oxoacyl-[acyl-carrier-protein] synthase-1